MIETILGKHVDKLLSAYCHEELSAAEKERVARHLQDCLRCHRAYEEIHLGAQLAAQLQRVAAPESLQVGRLEMEPARQDRIWWRQWQVALATTAVFVLLLGGWMVWRRAHQKTIQEANIPRTTGTPTSIPTPVSSPGLITPSTPKRIPSKSEIAVRPKRMALPAWEVENITGRPRIGSTEITDTGKLGVGEWLETDNDSKAKIKVAEIGYVDIDPNSRVRLVETRDTEHRIALAKGKMSALILAPPRLFIVDTPSATAVDLGCAYTLEVDEYGGSLLHVTSGWVSFIRNGRESFIPAGAMCATRKGGGVGTPYFSDATARFREALNEIDFGKGIVQPSTVERLLDEARQEDALTLWHLLGREFAESELATAMREQIYERLSFLSPPPKGVTKSGILKRDLEMLNLWWEEKIR